MPPRILWGVDLKLELRREESREALHHTLARPTAADVNVAVVRVPREAKAAPLQLPVQLVEHEGCSARGTVDPLAACPRPPD